MTGNGRQTTIVVLGYKGEAADRPLSSLVVPIEQVNGDGFRFLDGVPDSCECRLGRVSKGTLPDAHTPSRHVDIAGEALEIAQAYGVYIAWQAVGMERPPV